MFTINSILDSLVIEKTANKFGDSMEKHEMMSDMLCLSVKKENIHGLLSFLKEDKELDFNFLTTLCGMHYPETEQLGVVYHLHSFAHNHRIQVKTTTSIQIPTIQSITDIWPAANWMEREAYDFFGILFEGHPNLKRILNVDEMKDFPLRKDFPLEDQTREDKDNRMFGR